MRRKVEVDAAAIRAAQACQAKHDVRYYLVGVFFGKDGSVAGTNGHVLAVTNTESKLFGEDVILRIRGTIPKTAKTVTFDTRALYCRTDNDKLFAIEVIDGKYPDIHKVIPGTDREAMSQYVAFNPSYMALVDKVFKPGAAVRLYPGEQNQPLLLVRGDTRLAIMPMRDRTTTFRRFVPENTAPTVEKHLPDLLH